jgi:hypothetical protein
LLVSQEATDIEMRVVQLQPLGYTIHDLSLEETVTGIHVYVEDAVHNMIPRNVALRLGVIDQINQIVFKSSSYFHWIIWLLRT